MKIPKSFPCLEELFIDKLGLYSKKSGDIRCMHFTRGDTIHPFSNQDELKTETPNIKTKKLKRSHLTTNVLLFHC